MCMAAMRLAGINAVTYAYSNEDGAPHGLSTAAIYDDLAKPFSQQTMESAIGLSGWRAGPISMLIGGGGKADPACRRIGKDR